MFTLNLLWKQLCDTHGINQSSTFAGIFRLSLRYHYINIYITYIYYITFTLGIYIKKYYRYLQTLSQISAEKNSTIIFPLPIGQFIYSSILTLAYLCVSNRKGVFAFLSLICFNGVLLFVFRALGQLHEEMRPSNKLLRIFHLKNLIG